MNPDRVLESFLEMVAIESPSWHEAPMAAYCAEKLAEMGFTVTFDASAAETGSDTGNLIAHLPGTVPGRIGFSAHLDTVKPCAGIEAVIEQRHICDDVTCRMAEVVCSAGETILSADDKAGIAAIFEGLRSVLESGTPRPDITVLLTTCEEQSLLGAGALAEGALAWPKDLPAATPEAERDGRFPLFVLDADGAPPITGRCALALRAVPPMPAWSPRRASPPFRSPQPPWPPCRLGASTSAPRPTSAASRAALP